MSTQSGHPRSSQFDAGIELYGIGAYRSALPHLARSIALWPFNWHYPLYLARSLAGCLRTGGK